MKSIKKPLISLLLALAFISALAPAAFAAGDGAGNNAGDSTGDFDIEAVIADTAELIQQTVTDPGIGQVGGEWAMIALARSGASVPESYIQAYYDKVAGQLNVVKGLLSTVKYSEYSRVALAISAIGGDPRNVGGYDMLAPLMDFDNTVNQGIHGPIFALIALAGAAEGTAPVTGRFIDYILSKQLEDGGFAISGTVSDPDTTAMTLTALSGYRSRADVSDSIGRAVERLSLLQRQTGGFTSYSSTNSESVSQVIIALCSLGIPVSDARFIKDGNTLTNNLMTYYAEGGGFEHERGGGVSLMATEQALCAMAALWRVQTGRNALYDMSDAPAGLPGAPSGGLEGKNPDVNVPAANFITALYDISGDENEAAILALAERGIVSGFSPGRFEPSRTITRAEFAAVIVRALGLRTDGTRAVFSDVPDGSWFSGYVRAAADYGLAQGRGPGLFVPGAQVTRQEAAVMLRRAAALCGLNEEFDETAIRNVLAQFTDYRTVGAWASEPLAFCYYYGIMDDSALEIMPSKPVLRGEAAGMVYGLLSAAGLA